MLARLFAPALAAASLLLALPAHAEPMAVTVGQTKTMVISVPLTSVKVDDKGVLAARKVRQGIELVGQAPGKTELHVRTADGETMDFTISIVSAGSSVYETHASRG